MHPTEWSTLLTGFSPTYSSSIAPAAAAAADGTGWTCTGESAATRAGHSRTFFVCLLRFPPPHLFFSLVFFLYVYVYFLAPSLHFSSAQCIQVYISSWSVHSCLAAQEPAPPKKRKKQNKTKAVTIPRETIQGYIRLYTARVTKS